MTTPNTTTTYGSMLMVNYYRGLIERLGTTETPVFNMMGQRYKKVGGGKHFEVPIDYGNAGIPGHNFADARGDSQPSDHTAFVVTRQKVYSSLFVENELVEVASRGDDHAHKDVQNILDGGVEQCRMKIAHRMFRDSGGSIGQLASTTTVASTTAIFTDIADMLQLKKNMPIQFGPNKDGTSLRNSGSTINITAVDIGRKQATTSANINTVTGTVAGDYVFRKGDATRSFAGFDDWLPGVASPSALFSVTRTDDVERLSGQAYSQGGDQLDTFCSDVIAEGRIRGTRFDAIIMNPLRTAELTRLRDPKSIVEMNLRGPLGIGVPAFQFVDRGRRVTVIESPNCQTNLAWALTFRTWRCYKTVPKFPHFIVKDSLFHMQESSDQFEVRMAGYGNFACTAPYRNARLTLNTLS